MLPLVLASDLVNCVGRNFNTFPTVAYTYTFWPTKTNLTAIRTCCMTARDNRVSSKIPCHAMGIRRSRLPILAMLATTPSLAQVYMQLALEGQLGNFPSTFSMSIEWHFCITELQNRVQSYMIAPTYFITIILNVLIATQAIRRLQQKQTRFNSGRQQRVPE